MGTTGGVRVVGLTRVVRDLQAMGVEVTDLKVAFGQIAQEAATLAAGFARRKSGRLAASIKGSKAKNYASVKAGGVRVPYAAVQNYGWTAHNIQPSGFMQRADLVMRPRALHDIKKAVEKIILEKGLQ